MYIVDSWEIREQAPATLPPTPFPTKTPTRVPSEVPTIANTNVDPTTAPTKLPTHAPVTTPCSDSPLRLKILKNGSIIARSCEWVEEQTQEKAAISLECLPPVRSPVEAATLAPILGCVSNSTTTETTSHEAANL